MNAVNFVGLILGAGLAVFLVATLLFPEAIKDLGANGGGLQRQLRPPVREPHQLDELDRDLPAAVHPVQPAVEAGQVIPGDGDVIEGIASVDESAITGESAPVIRVKADGSLTDHGSHLIGQSFVDFDGNLVPKYFQSRPPAAGDGYDPTATAASNLGPESIEDTLAEDPDDATQSLLTQVCARSLAVGELEPGKDYTGGVLIPIRGDAPGEPAVPADAVTASASGLDPHISLAYARLQAPRVARERGTDLAAIQRLIDA